MRNTIVIMLVSLIAAGCTKDKFTTKPQLKYKSVSSTVVGKDQIFQFKLSFTDLEGDLPDTNGVYIQKVSPTCPSGNFSFKVNFPNSPGSTIKEGDLTVTLANGINLPPEYQQYVGYSVAPVCGADETCTFRFMIRDKAGNRSDTAVSESITLKIN